MRNHFLESRNGVFHGHGIDAEFRFELLHFLHRREAQRVIGEAQPLGITLIDGYLMVETEQVDEETSHLTCAQYQNLHCVQI